jgi:predicted RNA-binding protein YlqC (UPF0109 family)
VTRQLLITNKLRLVTSRLLESIQEELEDFEQLEIKAHKSDIELFVDRQIRKNKNLRQIVQKITTLREDIKEGVAKTAENMYFFPRHLIRLERSMQSKC